MNILLVAATKFEIQPAIDYLEAHPLEASTSVPQILITGVGAVATTFHLTKYLAASKPDLIIQAGVGGSFRREIARGSVFCVAQEIFGDMGVMESGDFRDVFDLGLTKENDFPFSAKRLRNPHTDLVKDLQIPLATSIGVAEVTTSRERIETILKKYNPDIESMEGAAFHYVCLQENIRFIQLRAISNYVGERDKEKWELKGAIINLHEQLIQLISFFH